MFRISFFCDDKKLPLALHALTGIAADAPEVQPVVNSTTKNGKVVADGDGDTATLFAKYAKTHKLTKFKAGDITGFVKQLGMAPASRTYLLNRLVSAGVLKKVGTGYGMTYVVKS